MYKVRPKDPIVRNGVTNGAPIGIAENQWVSLGVSFFPRKSVEFAIIPFITGFGAHLVGFQQRRKNLWDVLLEQLVPIGQ